PADAAPHGEARALRGDPDDDARGRVAGGRWMMRLARLLVVAVGLSAAVARAQWGGRDWQDLSPDDRRRAWENYQRYRQLPEERQRMLDHRYQQFQALPPQEQQRLRQNYQQYRGLDPGQRREFAEKYRRWKSERR